MALLLRVLLFVMIGTFMLEVGINAPRGASKTLRAGAVFRAVLVMLILGPLAALGIAELFAPTPQVVAALVLLSVVGVLPVAARRAQWTRGDLACGIMLTLVLGVLASLTAAPSARALLHYTGEVGFRPQAFLIQILVLQVVPLAVGVLIRSSSRREAIRRVVHVINAVTFAAVVALVLPRVGAVLEVGWRGVAAAIVFAVAISAIAHAIGGPSVTDRRTLAGIANKPNVALALAIASSAGAKPSMTVVLIGIFFIRVFTGVLLAKVIPHRVSASAAAPEKMMSSS